MPRFVSLASQASDKTAGGFTHLDLLVESIDFSPYASGNTSVSLPERIHTLGSIAGWERNGPTQAEEPVDMLKYVMDLSLERSDNITDMNVQRFMFWCKILMRSFLPLLYPKVCAEVGLKDKTEKLGFFHHCPGSFQRVMARWLYKLRSKQKFMDALWSRKDYVDVIIESLRQRFAYRDPELIVDGIKFYSQLCKGSQYIPSAMLDNLHEVHVLSLFVYMRKYMRKYTRAPRLRESYDNYVHTNQFSLVAPPIDDHSCFSSVSPERSL